MSTLTERFDTICERISRAVEQSGRSGDAVQLVAVSKTRGAEDVVALARHWALSGTGKAVFGESYVQEAVGKQRETAALLSDCAAEWHFIGHIQSRKSRDVVGAFSLLHSVDSLKLAGALQKAWENIVEAAPVALREAAPGPQAVLVQINVGREAQKSGVDPEDLEMLLNGMASLRGLRVDGLMCIPPNLSAPEESRPYFALLRELRDKMSARCGLALPHLSMGMSDDFEAAIAEGATMVRIGSDIFGQRLPAAT